MAIVFGTAGNDRILPAPPSRVPGPPTPTDGNDQISALAGDDVVAGGRGDDTVDLGDGNDRFLWQAGDGNDVVDGGAGTDTLQLDMAGQNVRFDLFTTISGRLGVEFPIDGGMVTAASVERVAIDADRPGGTVGIGRLAGSGVQQVDVTLGAGAVGQHVIAFSGNAGDSLAVSGDAAAIRVDGLGAGVVLHGAEAHDQLTLRLGAGNDLANLTALAAGAIAVTVEGGDGDDVVIGHAGSDRVIGGKGIDLVQMGAGDDRYEWRIGDGNDQVDGGAGTDTLAATASHGNDRIDLRGDAGGATLSTVQGGENLRLSAIERVELAMLGGRDDVSLSGLEGSGIAEIALSLSPDGAAGTPDRVITGASSADDSITLAAQPGGLMLQGMPWRASIVGLDAQDLVSVAALDGNDSIDAHLAGTAAQLRLDGGAGNDTITGSDGKDHLIGGLGDDVVRGGGGDDLVQLGDGDDRALWRSGDGSDRVNGGSGTDRLMITQDGTPAPLTFAADAGKAVVQQQEIGVWLEAEQLEIAEIAAGAGNNRITVGDLSGTALRIVQVTLDAGGAPVPAGKFDDAVSVVGTSGADAVSVIKGADGIEVNGLHARTIVAGTEAGRDLVAIDTGAGDDSIDALALPAGNVTLDIATGAGNDTVTGHAGTDFVTGGTGNDTVQLGAGDDTFFWFVGDGQDKLKGDAGHDQVTVLGGSAGEGYSLVAVGTEAWMTQGTSISQVQSQGVEAFTLLTGGGVDDVAVGNLAATTVREVTLNLGGDGVLDFITADGTQGADAVRLSGGAGSVAVQGLAAALTLDATDAIDRLTLRLGDGADTLDATQLADGAIDLIVSAGGGDDLLLGGADAERLQGEAGNDTLQGGGGDDVLLGGDGADLIIGGTGNDRMQGDAGADLFRFAPPDGTDRIQDFAAGLDRIQLLGFGTELDSFAEVMAVAAQVGSEVRIDLGANTDQGGLLILENTTIGQLSAADFVFG
jgi:Ca2+-binding RTX toxin-like protein